MSVQDDEGPLPALAQGVPVHPRDRGEAALAAVLCMLLRITRREGKLLAKMLARDVIGTNNTVKTHICTLRQKLKPFDIEVRTVIGLGYAIDTDARAKIRDILARHDTEFHSARRQRPNPRVKVSAADATVVTEGSG